MNSRITVDNLGKVSYNNFPLYHDLSKMCERERNDLFALKTCGGHCGDSNCG